MAGIDKRIERHYAGIAIMVIAAQFIGAAMLQGGDTWPAIGVFSLGLVLSFLPLRSPYRTMLHPFANVPGNGIHTDEFGEATRGQVLALMSRATPLILAIAVLGTFYATRRGWMVLGLWFAFAFLTLNQLLPIIIAEWRAPSWQMPGDDS